MRIPLPARPPLLLALALLACHGKNEDTIATEPIPAGGANPCGSCAADEYCKWSYTGPGDCTPTGCEPPIKGGECETCLASPDRCGTETANYCAESFVCYIASVEGLEIADDGTLVVYCSSVSDTSCGP